MSIEVARAAYGYDACWTLGPTPYPAPPGAVLLLEDGTGDGRPDLWVIGAEENGVTIVVYTFASGYTEHLPPLELGPAGSSAASFLIGDRDLDGSADLFVIEPGDPVRLSIRGGPRFSTVTLTTDLPLSGGTDEGFLLGDRDGDGLADLFAVGPERVAVLSGAGGFVGEPEISGTDLGREHGRVVAVDFDGDGRDDLGSVGSDGAVVIHLGGDRSGSSDADLMSWFLVGDDRPWEYRDGCPAAADLR
jgi:hypothetical protein